uniref:(northern house mosquito) hypothetical protein n=1 Tax=Culex pipiens TaxID=7175 RepID=A0A8D8FQH9_CULPI
MKSSEMWHIPDRFRSGIKFPPLPFSFHLYIIEPTSDCYLFRNGSLTLSLPTFELGWDWRENTIVSRWQNQDYRNGLPGCDGASPLQDWSCGTNKTTGRLH